jgi:hypothetical protein
MQVPLIEQELRMRQKKALMQERRTRLLLVDQKDSPLAEQELRMG